ncbi:SHOCT domain-containing protein [Dethiothermospora halolimnae]|uniref:SHOCT domain-containing protein n=1 Tax=Dethiothermospora halolimnae TaxID=3114390 RepID=UPI003CCB9FA5
MHMFGRGFDFFNGFNGFWPLMILGGILRIAVIGVVIYLVYRLISKENSKNQQYRASHRAVDILKERYAKGEISEEEYEQKMRKLRE